MSEDKPKTYRDLCVYQKSFELAMALFHATAHFPFEERFALVDQIRRAARSIPTNLAEGWAKRKYQNIFKRHLIDGLGSCEELKVWLRLAWECSYLDNLKYEEFTNKCNLISAMLSGLIEKF